jgi:type IV pilus assembly protein PilE
MQKTKGFTLIELMITVAVIAILASIAFPAYQDSVRKARRAEAKSALLQVAQILERCFTEFNAYNNLTCEVVDNIGGTPGINFDTDDITKPINGEGYYNIEATTLTTTTYTIEADALPAGGQDQDTRCATFTLTHAGVKGATNDDCW